MNQPVCMVCMTPKVKTDPDNPVPHARWSCESDMCRQYAEMPNVPITLSDPVVPGGHNDVHKVDKGYQFHKNFDKGMDDYKAARDEGLKPKATTSKAVAEAKEEVKSHERAKAKLIKAGMGKEEVNNMKTAAGVE